MKSSTKTSLDMYIYNNYYNQLNLYYNQLKLFL